MKNKEQLVIIGASGHGKVVADVAIKMGNWNEIVYLDDDVSKETVMGLSVIGKSGDFTKYVDKYDVFVAIGNNAVRELILKKLIDLNATIPTLIHPNTVIGCDVKVGIGSVVMAGCIINPSTTIGVGCIVNTGAIIDHDNRIADYVHLSPGVKLAGTVNVGKCCWLGVGSTVINNINIAAGCTIGAGSVVIKDISETGIYVGTPVRRVEK